MAAGEPTRGEPPTAWQTSAHRPRPLGTQVLGGGARRQREIQATPWSCSERPAGWRRRRGHPTGPPETTWTRAGTPSPSSRAPPNATPPASKRAWSPPRGCWSRSPHWSRFQRSLSVVRVVVRVRPVGTRLLPPPPGSGGGAALRPTGSRAGSTPPTQMPLLLGLYLHLLWRARPPGGGGGARRARRPVQLPPPPPR